MTGDTHRRLPDAMTLYRIGDPRGAWPIWSDGGARRTSGRWHEAGQGVIYASEHYSTAMLEKLLHFAGELPGGQCWIDVQVPAGVSYAVFPVEAHPDWAGADMIAARRFGRTWHAEGLSCLLFVPSVVARVERNVIVNTAHPDFGRLRPGLERPVWWDARLFAREDKG